ncbi:MAG: HD domain-containing protein [Saprospiraceae bacterium]|nr:HD domain-containing protein [Saprospiraceae bacterium]MBP6569512.1 HD domain-containing protein [Saprospiraceae bacterium]
MNKKKIFNDPIYGLIRFNHDILYEIIDHPYFQRLRRISQQALSHYVYPGALHTRFQHALGALHLMTRALDTIKSKGVEISDDEYEAGCVAILLHDIGHGPFSHALEHALANVHHENISLLLIQKIAEELNKDFTLAIQIFKGEYHRPFLHQLVSGQIDVDRMDYLTRDSFYSGVAEGIIGYDRIITMMNVVNEQLVIEEKGIYSVEKFLMARRLMYWQVYLHKTVISAEVMLISILKRARYLAQQGTKIASSDELTFFLTTPKDNQSIIRHPDFLKNFVLLDDMDILWMIKKSVNHEDFVMQYLCKNLLDRKLLKVTLYSEESFETYLKAKNAFQVKLGLNDDEIEYFFSEKKEVIFPYDTRAGEINMLMKSGRIQPYSALNPNLLTSAEERTFLFYQRDIIK